MSQQKQPKIAIVGAGPGGLTLANILQKNQIPFTIYESSEGPRHSGGTLDLHPNDGQEALKQAGLWDAFVQHARPEADVMKVVTNSGEVLWDGNGPEAYKPSESEKFNGRPEIDRGLLMKILIGNLEPSSLLYSHKVLEVQPVGNGKHNLKLADGTMIEDLDLIVGADGAWSKVRNLLTDTKPYYSGISGIELWKNDVDTTNPWMSAYVGAGSLFSFGQGRSIQIQRMGDGSMRAYGCLRQPESFLEACGIDWSQPESARKEYVARYFADCGDDLKRVLLESDDALFTRPLYMLPVGHRFAHQPGLTLLGDAAHLMTPFAGVGVNAALADAVDLAKAITAHAREPQKRTLTHVVQRYEEVMFKRGTRFQEETWGNLNKHFSAEGSEEFAGKLRLVYGNTMKAAIVRKVVLPIMSFFE